MNNAAQQIEAATSDLREINDQYAASKESHNLRTFDDYHGDDFILERTDESGKYCLTEDYLEMDGIWQESCAKLHREIVALKQQLADKDAAK